MNTLLVLPAVALIYLQALGRDKALRQALIMAQIQFLLGTPFLSEAPRSYFTKAFEFTRQFFFEWTVNWRFVGEEVFLSKKFSLGLLALHATLLFVFVVTRWKKFHPRPSLIFLEPTNRSPSIDPRNALFPPSSPCSSPPPSAWRIIRSPPA